MWNAVGLALCCIAIVISFSKSKHPHAGYYASEVYGMTARTHRAYAQVSAVFALLFVAGFFVPVLPTIPLLAAYVLVFIFYLSSFLRGFGDQE